MSDKPTNLKLDTLTAKIRRAEQRAERLPRQRHAAEGALLAVAEREQRLANLRDTNRAAELANRVKPNGGGPQ